MDARPGWRLHLICVVCKTEAVYEGVVLSLAVEVAERNGWQVDREAVHESAENRYATCPNHTVPTRH